MDTNTKMVNQNETEKFKSAITRIRDILRGPGVSITGMDSMRHICLYILSRYMTIDRVKQLGVPEKFAWENLIETVQTKNGGLQLALDYFYHTEDDCLVNYFDKLFGTDKFSFDITNLRKHKEILEIIDSVKMEEVKCDIDILGSVYEQHLKTGSAAARDLGQFFTDRFICAYMTDLCKPNFKSTGVPESVCDPSMGTGGFLATYIKYFEKNFTENPIDWNIQQKEIHGCDTDPKVAGFARLNIFMETGGSRPVNLLTHDSLYGDLPQTGYDIILANMPFGLKGIKHAECCERVKSLKINGTKSEPLFLQLMMVSLNDKGRCAVVVPDGMLVNSSKCHDGTRQYLLENFELKRVIKMKGQFFMNTVIQPSILFFEKSGKPTKSVEFWEVVKDDKGKNEPEEKMIISVPYDKIKKSGSYSLDMRRYMESDKPKFNLAGYPMVKLGEIAELCRNNTPIIDDKDGDYIKYFGPKKVGMCSNYHFDGEYIITPNRQSIGLIGYINGKFTTTHTFVIKINQKDVNVKYVYYYLKLTDKLSGKSKGVIPFIKNDDVLSLDIIIPPLSVQEENVATLDRIYNPGTTDLADTIKLTDRAMDLVLIDPSGASLEPVVEAQKLIRKSAQMVADVKAQMVAIMKSIEFRGFPVVKLEEISKYENGKTLKSSDKTEDGEYDVMGGGMNYIGKTANFNRTGETISISKSGASAGFVAYHNKNYWAGDCLTLTPKDNTILIKYMYYYLKLNNDLIMSNTSGSTIPHCKWDDIKNISIQLPPLDFQTSIVERLDNLQRQLTSLDTLQKQSDDNARFILDSYFSVSADKTD